METATILTREAFKKEIIQDAETVIINYVKGVNESGETTSEVEFKTHGKLVVVEFLAYMGVERARFQGTYDCPPDEDEVNVDIDWMDVSVTNDYEPLKNINAFINQ